MSETTDISIGPTTTGLTAKGYWPARAARFVAEEKYARAVEVCRENLAGEPALLSGRLVFGRALFLTGQEDAAEEQFHYVLSIDPDNLVALKYLADIKYGRKDEPAAVAYYRRIMEIDPHNRGLACDIARRKKETTRTISISRGPEKATVRPSKALRDIPFYTETMGDLYLAQGHSRLAAEVFRNLTENNSNPRLQEKLSEAEGKVR